MAYFSRRARRDKQVIPSRAEQSPQSKKHKTSVSTSPLPDQDPEMNAEKPLDSNGMTYVQRDEYEDDPNYDTVEDELWENYRHSNRDK